MKVEDYLTQEMIDKLQNAVDDNNGVIDIDDLHPLLDGFKNFLINNITSEPSFLKGSERIVITTNTNTDLNKI